VKLALFAKRFVDVLLVLVLLVEVNPAKLPLVALKLVVKKLVVVLFVVEALLTTRVPCMVALFAVRRESVAEATDRSEMVVVARVEVPVTVKRLDTDVVPVVSVETLALVAVRLVTIAESAERSVEKKPVDDVALVMLLLVPVMVVALRFVDVLLEITALVAKRLVDVLLVVEALFAVKVEA
jgi:hypothetical protein